MAATNDDDVSQAVPTVPDMVQLSPGDKAPAIALLDQTGAKVRLSGFKGRKVLVFFYPKADTPGCTTQACGLRDAWSELSAKAKVFGISIDPVKKHAKFIGKYSLPFPLLSDEAQTMVEAYGVWVEKSMYGKTYFGTERTTFVIDEKGIVKAILPKVKPAEHVDQLLAVL